MKPRRTQVSNSDTSFKIERQFNGHLLDASLDLPEFIAFMARKVSNIEEASESDIKSAFNLFATGDYIDAHGFSRMLKSIDEPVGHGTINSLNTLIEEADSDGDGKISFEGELHVTVKPVQIGPTLK